MLTLFYSIHFLHKLFTLFDQFQSEDEDQFVVPGHGMPEADRDCWWAEGKKLEEDVTMKIFISHLRLASRKSLALIQSSQSYPYLIKPRSQRHAGARMRLIKLVFPGSSFLWKEDGPGGWGRYPWWWVQGNLDDNVAATIQSPVADAVGMLLPSFWFVTGLRSPHHWRQRQAGLPHEAGELLSLQI